MSSKKKKVETAYGYSSETDHLVEFNKPQPKKRSYRTCGVVAAVFAVLLVLGAAGAGVGLGINYGLKSSSFEARITSSNLMQHLQDLDNIAKEYELEYGQYSRAVQYGYNKSAEMVMKKLQEAGFEDVQTQTFTVATYEDSGESSLTVRFGEEFAYSFVKSSQYSVMRYSNTTNGFELMGDLDIVEESCIVDNYTTGTVALVNYNLNATELGCTLLEMTELAASAGAIAIIMMRMENDTSSVAPTTRIYQQDGNTFQVAPIPVFGATYSAGSLLKDVLDLSNTGTVQVFFSTNTTVGFYETYNVLAYTSDHLNDDVVVVVGSHLDSVAAGPGINDNGSGSAANLEIALQVIRNMKPINKVLFAFWGAEELGLLGSTYYVNSLDEDQRNKIALNLNYDMIGSPNYVRQIYNGSGAENEKIVKASGKIQELFEEYFVAQDLDFSLKAFNGRSDYGPFIAEGVDIPAGGLATGADETKTEEERRRFGGVANAILDPCYHQICDTVDNVDEEVFQQMSQAAAYVLNILMMKENLKDFLNEG